MGRTAHVQVRAQVEVADVRTVLDPTVQAQARKVRICPPARTPASADHDDLDPEVKPDSIASETNAIGSALLSTTKTLCGRTRRGVSWVRTATAPATHHAMRIPQAGHSLKPAQPNSICPGEGLRTQLRAPTT